jgi:hypothetical protein
MDTVEVTKYALGNAFDILGQVCADLTQEQCDWIPPGIANPIGALYWHTVSGADEVVYRWALGQDPLHQQEGWRDRVLAVAVTEPEGTEGWLEHMRAIRVELPALHDYARAVAAALQAWLGFRTPEDLDRVVHTPIGEYTLAQMLNLFVIWHIDAHCGEISALKGCQGARGYPF